VEGVKVRSVEGWREEYGVWRGGGRRCKGEGVKRSQGRGGWMGM
jgi:hypothetical protein